MHAAEQSHPLPRVERRSFERVPVAVFGRCMFENKLETPCQAINISPGDIALICSHQPAIGEHVIAYMDNLGRLEGFVARQFDGGFALVLDCTERKREKLQTQIEWLRDNMRFGSQDLRRHDRIEPRQTMLEIRLEDGRAYPIEIIDISLSGAALRCEVRPAAGSKVSLGGMQGTVIRHFDEGIAIEFANVQTMAALENTSV